MAGRTDAAPVSPDVRRVSRELLAIANRGLGKFEFLRQVSRLLLELTGCSGLVIRLGDGPVRYRWEARSATPELDAAYIEVPRGDSEPGPPDASWGGARTISDFEVDEDNHGTLVLARDRGRPFPARDRTFHGILAQMVGSAIADRRARAALRERVKELTCLYGIARVVERGGELGEILRCAVELLPPAWLFPERASARIVVDGAVHATAGFGEGGHVLATDVVVRGLRRGVVEVRYADVPFGYAERPFLDEERSLITAVAREVAGILERSQAESEHERLQEQLRHADRLATIGQLSAGVAHELNEPLGGILGFAQLAAKAPGLPPGVGADLEKIVGASLYAREVIKKLMLFARQMPPRRAMVDLRALVGDSLWLFQGRCIKGGIELRVDLPDGLSMVEGDAAHLRQVVVNLVVNAIQALPRGGILTVAGRREGDRVVLSVSDTGVGMDEATRAQCFLPFFTTKDVDEGTGLGLSVVHGIVTAHGGTITVESEVGRGTRFDVRLPVAGSAGPRE